MSLLQVGSGAVRTSLSRLCRDGWLVRRRCGRNSLYGPTPKGRNLLEEGSRRIYEPRCQAWDGLWRVVVYTLPEKNRDLREALRRRLRWLGYGSLAPGTWISPNDRMAEVNRLLDDLELHDFVECFVARRVHGISEPQLVQRCWNLAGLGRDYAAFLRRWEPRLRRHNQAAGARSGIPPPRCFKERFWIVHEYSDFPNRDPNLPLALLPAGWLGDESARLFHRYQGMLAGSVSRFVDDMLAARPSPRAPRKARGGAGGRGKPPRARRRAVSGGRPRS